jgi:sterol desaturase/sphingolipid hydroxylase (fatty acid hydroxylase superfamily)
MDKYIKIFALISSRYFILAGAFFFVFYILLKKKKEAEKIQRNFPENLHYKREVFYSILTMLIFSFVPLVFIQNEKIAATTLLYSKISSKGWFYFFAVFPIMMFIHDTYFYWTHRLMHHKRLFKLFHLVHHKSTNPSPWAAYAFHPLEAVVEVGVFLVFLYCVPMHRLHFFIFFLFSIAYNIYGHLGFELYPKNFNKSKIGKWINTSVSHNQHHQFFKGNYGLYLLFGDRVMGTIRQDYDMSFEKATIK